MNRREAISAVSMLLGGTVVGTTLFLEGCVPTEKKVTGIPFDEDTINLLNEIADSILPTTPSSPGAKAANVAKFMNTMVRDCYETSNQQIFFDGISMLQDACKTKFNTAFMDCSAEQRTELLIGIDNEQKAYTASKKKEDPAHYFRMMKELTILGYFTSEIGATQALRYVAVPGRYEGCVPYTKGEKAWATS